MTETLRSSPIMFIENAGHFDERARFQVRVGPRSMRLTDDAIWITLVECPHVDPEQRFLMRGRLPSGSLD